MTELGSGELREVATALMNLNVEDLDMEDLEHRLKLVTDLRQVGLSLGLMAEFDCGRFRCGSYR